MLAPARQLSASQPDPLSLFPSLSLSFSFCVSVLLSVRLPSTARAIVCMPVCRTRMYAVHSRNGIGWELDLLTPVDAEVHVAVEATAEREVQDSRSEVCLRLKFRRETSSRVARNKKADTADTISSRRRDAKISYRLSADTLNRDGGRTALYGVRLSIAIFPPVAARYFARNERLPFRGKKKVLATATLNSESYALRTSVSSLQPVARVHHLDSS